MTAPLSSQACPAVPTRLQLAAREDRVRADRMRLIFAATHADLDDEAQTKRYYDGLEDQA